MSVFSVFIRKQVSITRKFHNHYDDETQYTDSHTTARKHLKIVSEYDQEIPQSQTADNPVAPGGRAAQPSQDTRKTN